VPFVPLILAPFAFGPKWGLIGTECVCIVWLMVGFVRSVLVNGLAKLGLLGVWCIAAAPFVGGDVGVGPRPWLWLSS
jgi:uncharacterized membrane protein